MRKLLLVIAAALAFSGLAFAAVDLNTADQKQLESVKGIGPVKAKAIIEHRQKNGPFKSVNDLKNVTGFSDKTVESLKGEVTVGAATPKEPKREEKKMDEKKTDKKETESTKATAETAKPGKTTEPPKPAKPAEPAKSAEPAKTK